MGSRSAAIAHRAWCCADGKSTWARRALPDALRLDLLDEALFTDLLGDPSLFGHLLAVRLPAFEAKLRVRERRRPKLYWADPGLVRAVKRQLGPVAAEERGALVEGWVLGLLRALQHLHAQRAARPSGSAGPAAPRAGIPRPAILPHRRRLRRVDHAPTPPRPPAPSAPALCSSSPQQPRPTAAPPLGLPLALGGCHDRPRSILCGCPSLRPQQGPKPPACRAEL